VLLSTIVAAFHCGVFDLSLVYFYMPFMYMQALAAMLIRKSLRCLASMSSTDWRGIPVADVQHLWAPLQVTSTAVQTDLSQHTFSQLV